MKRSPSSSVKRLLRFSELLNLNIFKCIHPYRRAKAQQVLTKLFLFGLSEFLMRFNPKSPPDLFHTSLINQV